MPARKRTTRKRTTRRKRTPLQMQKAKLALAKRARNAAETKMEALAYKVETIESIRGRPGEKHYKPLKGDTKIRHAKLSEQLHKAIKQVEKKARTTNQLHRRLRGK